MLPYLTKLCPYADTTTLLGKRVRRNTKIINMILMKH